MRNTSRRGFLGMAASAAAAVVVAPAVTVAKHIPDDVVAPAKPKAMAASCPAGLKVSNAPADCTLSPEYVSDLMSKTLRDLGPMRFEKIYRDIDYYEVFSKWFKKDRVSFYGNALKEKRADNLQEVSRGLEDAAWDNNATAEPYGLPYWLQS